MFPPQGVVNLYYKNAAFCHLESTICHPNSSNIITILCGMFECGCNNGAVVQKKLFSRFLPSVTIVSIHSRRSVQWSSIPAYIGVNRPAFGGTVPHFHQMSREMRQVFRIFFKWCLIFFCVADYFTFLP